MLHTLQSAILTATTDERGSVIAGRMGSYLTELGDGASRIAEGIPPELKAMSAVAFLAGILLWVMGGRVLKPVFSFIGLIGGAMLGFAALPVFFTGPVFGISSPYAGLAVGGLAGLITAVVLLRFTVAVAAAGVAGIAAGFGVAVFIQYSDTFTSDDGPAPLVMTEPADADDDRPGTGRLFGLRPEQLLLDGVPIVEDLDDEQLRATAEDESADKATRAAAQAERVRRFTNEVIAEAGAGWSDAPAQSRLAIFAGSMSGIAAGFLFGLAMPRRSAAIVTAMAGSALWLANIAFVLDAANLPSVSVDSLSPATKLGIWGAVAMIGVVWQLAALARAKAAAD